MSSLLLTTLAAYFVASIHAVLAFINKRRVLERVAFYSLIFGFVLHTAVLIIAWIADGHYPLFGLKETLLFLAWTLVLSFLITSFRYNVQAFSSVTLPVVTLLTLTATIIGENNSELQKVLIAQTETWLPVHTTIWVFAYTALFVVFVSSAMYLIQERELKAKKFGTMFHRLPPLTTVNEIASTSTSLGFALITTGIATGILLSWKRDGKIWHNDPKEYLALITWVLYFALICYRSTANWRGKRAAWLGIAGFVFVLCTFFGARLMGSFHVFGTVSIADCGLRIADLFF